MRVDAYAKATGAATYTADIALADMIWIGITRSTFARATILSVDTSEAAHVSGVLGFLDGSDFRGMRYGRGVRDVPVLADGEVRFIGEPIVAVVAETREAAEAAADLVEVDYENVAAVVDPSEALAGTSDPVHSAPWEYDGADPTSSQGSNLQSRVTIGDRLAAEEAIKTSLHVVTERYGTQSVHQAYLEPHACVARVDADGLAHLWTTNKSPYLLMEQVGRCLSIDPSTIVVHPVMLGGDFGGKGSPLNAALCIEVARRYERPAKLMLRYADELTAGNPRHTASIQVTLGCDGEGRLTAAILDAVLDGGAYGGFKFWPNSVSGALCQCLNSYTIPTAYLDVRAVYTNSVPRGHVRAPGMPQGAFAVESAIDELAVAAKIDPLELRLRNVLADGSSTVSAGGRLLESVSTVRTDRREADLCPSEPGSWRIGRGLAQFTLIERPVKDPTFLNMVRTTLRMREGTDGAVEVETSTPETGTGSHTVLRNLLADALELERSAIRIIPATTRDLAGGVPASASRVTTTFAKVVPEAAKAWGSRGTSREVVVDYVPAPTVGNDAHAHSWLQEAVVAVDTETGQVAVQELTSVIEVGMVVNEIAHQMQIDGASMMGLGFCLMEDLAVEDGQVGAAQLGDYKIPTALDVPRLKTVLVRTGHDDRRVVPIGESGIVPTAAAVANAVYDAVGVRIRQLPITAEKVYNALEEGAWAALATNQ
jgi:CO/xanthine dehydrogenase Mo-binding subunit